MARDLRKKKFILETLEDINNAACTVSRRRKRAGPCDPNKQHFISCYADDADAIQDAFFNNRLNLDPMAAPVWSSLLRGGVGIMSVYGYYITKQSGVIVNRPEYMVATITPADLAPPNTRVPFPATASANRMRELDNRTNDEKGHILAHSLGGPTVIENLFPQAKSVNANRGEKHKLIPDWYVGLEKAIHEWLRNNGNPIATRLVDMQVTLHYENDQTGRPNFIQWIAKFYEGTPPTPVVENFRNKELVGQMRNGLGSCDSPCMRVNRRRRRAADPSSCEFSENVKKKLDEDNGVKKTEQITWPVIRGTGGGGGGIDWPKVPIPKFDLSCILWFLCADDDKNDKDNKDGKDDKNGNDKNKKGKPFGINQLYDIGVGGM